jgi:hypothetical protein
VPVFSVEMYLVKRLPCFKQDAILSFEAIMEIKIDHQSCYNLIVCYYVLGNIDKMKICFTKMLLVKFYDSESDDESEVHLFYSSLAIIKL